MSKKHYFRKSRKSKYKKRNIVLTVLIIICISYYFYNSQFDNSLHDFISTNLIIQSIFLFGILYTFSSPFYNLTFNKESDNDKIIEIIEEKKKNDEQLARIINDATIG